MKKIVIGTAAAVALSAGLAAPAQAENFRVGFLNTLSGGAAVLGKSQLAGWTLGLELEGWKKNGDKLGGVPTDILVGDDQRKPDVGLRSVRKWLKSERVHMVAGVIWSNILAAVQRPVIRAKRIMMSTNAGWSGMAGKNCSPYFISSSFQNDENAEAMGELLNLEGLKKVFMMAPNYQAGKDMLNGFQRTYKDGKVVGRILFKLGTRDFQAEISKVVASGADSVFIFVPGGMGVAFMKQWAASGAGQKVKLYTNYAVDYLTIKPIGKAAVGTFHTLHWGPNLDNPRNAEFIKAFLAKYKRIPDMFALQPYDGARKIADGLRGVKGNFKNLKNLVKVMRAQGLNSVRGQLKYNVNGFLIQPWYKRSVTLNAKGVPEINVNQMVTFKPDSFGSKCPKKSWN